MRKDNRNIELTYETDFIPENPDSVITEDKSYSANNFTSPDENKHANDSHAETVKKKVRVKDIIDGTFLVRENMIRQLPYVLFLTLLGIIYIGNRFHAEHMVRQIDELKVEVDNLRSEQITTTSELMNISRPSQVSALVQSKGLGLKESMEPPKKLKK